MNIYRNASGKSGIKCYETGSDFIKVQFKGGSIYTYTYSSAGVTNIERMKQLAENGSGLHSFIINFVKDSWQSKS